MMSQKVHPAILVTIIIFLIGTVAFLLGRDDTASLPQQTPQSTQSVQETAIPANSSSPTNEATPSPQPTDSVNDDIIYLDSKFITVNKTCSSNSDCLDINYCEKESCGDVDGICQEKPESCPLLLAQVCGCDSFTYSSSCKAKKTGVNVRKSGPCSTF